VSSAAGGAGASLTVFNSSTQLTLQGAPGAGAIAGRGPTVLAPKALQPSPLDALVVSDTDVAMVGDADVGMLRWVNASVTVSGESWVVVDDATSSSMSGGGGSDATPQLPTFHLLGPHDRFTMRSSNSRVVRIEFGPAYVGCGSSTFCRLVSRGVRVVHLRCL